MTTNNIKILIAMPTPGVLESETNDSVDLIKMHCASKGITLLTMKTEGVYVYQQRDVCVKRAKELGCTHLFFVDNDMVLPEHIIVRFLAWDKDVITTNYVVKAKRGKCSFSCIDENFRTVPLTEQSVGLQKVFAAPTGSMLIKMSAFDTLDEKLDTESLKLGYFGHRYSEKAKNIMGEDISFCSICNEAGVEVYIDCDISKQVEHIGKKAFNWKDAV